MVANCQREDGYCGANELRSVQSLGTLVPVASLLHVVGAQDLEMFRGADRQARAMRTLARECI